MALKILDRVKEAASTSGAGTFTLAGAMSGFRSFASQLADNDTTYYCAVNDVQFEIALGTKSGSTLARTKVFLNSNGDTNAVNFTAPPTVFATMPSALLSGPAFAAHSTAGPVAPVGWNKVSLPTKDFDTANCVDATGKFTPTVAGYYLITAQINLTASQSQIGAAVYKNGVIQLSGSSTAGWASSVSGVVYLNGTTDYVELFAYSGATATFANYAGANYMTGVLVRAG